jgi:hypothetical protein
MKHSGEFGCDEAEVIAQRAGERVAMRAEPAAGRQQGEHRSVHRRNAGEQLSRSRAERRTRGQEVAVPLQIEALPAGAEEGVEADVVVTRGRADVTLVEQLQRLVADHLPLRADLLQLGEVRHVSVRSRTHRRE